MPLTFDELNNRFGFHKGTIEGPEATAPKHARLRQQFLTFAKMLQDTIPDGRAKAVAMTELESASMWALKAIAETAPVVDETAMWVKANPSLAEALKDGRGSEH